MTQVTQLVSWNSSQAGLASCRLSAGPSHAEVLFGALVAFVVFFCCPGGWGSGWLGLALRMTGPRRRGFPLRGPGSQLTPPQRHLNRLVQCLSTQATRRRGCRRGASLSPSIMPSCCPESYCICWPPLPMCLSGLPALSARFCSLPDVSLAVPPKSTRVLGCLMGRPGPSTCPSTPCQKVLHGSPQFPESLAPCSEGLGPEESPEGEGPCPIYHSPTK